MGHETSHRCPWLTTSVILVSVPTVLSFAGIHIGRPTIGRELGRTRERFLPVPVVGRCDLNVVTLHASAFSEDPKGDVDHGFDEENQEKEQEVRGRSGDGNDGTADNEFGTGGSVDSIYTERQDMSGWDDGEEELEAYSLGDTEFYGLGGEYDADLDSLSDEAEIGMSPLTDADILLPGGMDVEEDLEDMLMERSIRFYDPKVTGERERCYLVGLEARGFGSRTQKGKMAFPEDKTKIGGRGDEDDWDEEQEAAYQEKKLRAYELRKEERDNRFTLEESMAELSELAGTAGLEVVGSTYQRVLEPNPRTYIGTGKVKEIKSAMNQLDVCTVIFDNELSPGQQRNLETEFGGEKAGIKVLDRTALILDIFAQHARTREGQLQVELALHMYRLPRLTKLWTHLERQTVSGGASGGVGLRGPGERQLEVDRRLLKDKIVALKKELGGVRRHRDLQRRSRRKLGLPVVSLVGYTNAGKSTLLNSLTRAGVMAENLLFATLDPTTRKVKLPGLKVHPEILLTDTVGFIQKLPTNLVAAFRATLEEVTEADVVVHVLDVSSPSWSKQESAVLGVLDEMGVSDKPRVTVWNKIDLLPAMEQGDLQIEAAMNHKLTVAASAMTGMGMDDFVTTLEEAVCELLMSVEAVVPYSRGDLLSRVHELGACDMEEYTEKGTFIKARVPAELVNRLEPYYTDEFRKTVDGGAGGKDEEEVNWTLIAKKRDRAKNSSGG